MNALKAQWVVLAGLFPGESRPQYTKAWQYTSEDYAADGDGRGERFMRLTIEADQYAAELRLGGLNWVLTEYMWL
jgi:hypothetical protein